MQPIIAEFSLGSMMIPGLVIFIFIGFMLTVKVMMSRYRKIPPNKVAIVFGRKAKLASSDGKTISGCRVVSGGGVLVWPVIEEMSEMDTSVFQVNIKEEGILNKDNVPINVFGAAMCKISTKPEDLQAAANSFLGQTSEDIQAKVLTTLTGHVRSIIGKLDIDGILRDRNKFNALVVEESIEELKRMGVEIVTVVIQEVNDQLGYIASLGRKAVAAAKRDADITVAEAEAETRKKTSEALKDAAIVEFKNAASAAEAEKDLAVQKATFKAAADTELAKANQAMAIATATQQQTLVVAEADRDAAKAQASIKVQEQEALRKEKELQVTIIRPAEAKRDAAVIEANGLRQAAEIKAEADKTVKTKNAEADAAAAERIGQGNAKKTLAEAEAEAAGNKAKLLAQADGEKAALLAKADGEAAAKGRVMLAEAEGALKMAEAMAAQKGKVLLAEAEGTLRMAEALAKLNQAGQFLMIMERLAPLLEKGGDAGAKIMQAIFGPIGQGMGQIDNVNITDWGGSAKGVGEFANAIPNTVFQVLGKLKAMGTDLSALGKMIGIDLSPLMAMMEKAGAPAAIPAAEPPAPAKK